MKIRLNMQSLPLKEIWVVFAKRTQFANVLTSYMALLKFLNLASENGTNKYPIYIYT